jgi:hypothetical protein
LRLTLKINPWSRQGGANIMTNTNTQKLITSIFHQKPSYSRDLTITPERLGLVVDGVPQAGVLIKPTKIDKSLLQPFDSISSKIGLKLNRLGLRSNGVVIVPSFRIREIKKFMDKMESEWQEKLVEVSDKFDQTQSKLWETIVNDPKIVDKEWKDIYLDHVKARMPSKDEFVARHQRFNWGVVPYFQGTVDMDGYDRVLAGLDFIRDGAVGSLIAEVTKTSHDMMEKIEKGNVQAGTQKLMIDLISKIADFSFLSPVLTQVSLEMHDKLSPILNGLRSINDAGSLKRLSILLKPLLNQHHLDDVIFYDHGVTLFGDQIKDKKKETAMDIIKRRESEIAALTEENKVENAKKLSAIRSMVNDDVDKQGAEMTLALLLPDTNDIESGNSESETVSTAEDKDSSLESDSEEEFVFTMAPSIF